MGHVYNPSTQEVEAEGGGEQEFGVILVSVMNLGPA